MCDVLYPKLLKPEIIYNGNYFKNRYYILTQYIIFAITFKKEREYR